MTQTDIYEIVDGIEFIQQEVDEPPVLHKYLVHFLVDRYGSWNPTWRIRESQIFVSALSFKNAEHLFAEWCSKNHLVVNVSSISEVE